MFEELKVLELASVLAGPSVGQFFAELGAKVIKVENLKSNGDVTRTWKTASEATDDRSAYFSSVNWGKRSILLNLESDQGQQIVHDLARQSNLVIASYKPGDALRLGVDYETLKHLNPDLIYGQVTGYGSDDSRVGYDAVIQAEGGFMFMNGEPGRSSLKMPVALIDILAAHHLKEGILLAMLRQKRNEKGGFVEVSLLQAAISSLANQATNWLIGRSIPQKQGSAHPNIAPYGDVFMTATGDEVLLAVGTDAQFQSLCSALDLKEVAIDRKFNSNTARVQNRIVLHYILQNAIRRCGTGVLVQKLQALRVPAGIVQNLEKVFNLPQAKEIILQTQGLKAVRTYVGWPLPQNASHFLPPPHAGEHTIEILSGELKLGEQAISELISRGIVH